MKATALFQVKHARVFAAVCRTAKVAEYNSREDNMMVCLMLNKAIGPDDQNYRVHKLFGCGKRYEVKVYQAYFSNCRELCPWTVEGIDIEGLNPENLGAAMQEHVKRTVPLETMLYALAGHENYRVSGDLWTGVIDKPNSGRPIYRITINKVAATSKVAAKKLKEEEKKAKTEKKATE